MTFQILRFLLQDLGSLSAAFSWTVPWRLTGLLSGYGCGPRQTSDDPVLACETLDSPTGLIADLQASADGLGLESFPLLPIDNRLIER